ncbi:MAG: phosphatase PAP2 family protein [Planctomycetota bacterium]|nr:phosphatase PAP2 family protein [Planctomycetota bacterium]
MVTTTSATPKCRVLNLCLTQVIFGGVFAALWFAGCALSTAHEHPATPWFDFEVHAPYLGWLIPLYLSQNVSVAILPFAFRDWREYFPVAMVMLFLGAIAAACFALFPMRLGFEGGSAVWAPLGSYLGIPDPGAGGYAPSLHVAYTVFIAMILSARWGPRWTIPFWMWVIGVSASTYFVHEHHLIDISTGALLGLAGVWIIRRPWITRLTPRSTSLVDDGR